MLSPDMELDDYETILAILKEIEEEEAKDNKTIKAYLSLQCLTSSLTSSEIMALIDNDTITKIKATDPHPFFQAYSICHEGTSQPSILGDTARPIHWTRAAVQSIKNIILKGIKFFKGHNADNSTENRESLGEIVASTEREIGGKLHHIAVGYFPNKEKVSDSDICSQEANWNLFEQAGHWFAETIDKLTGIALSNSKVDKPAFADAKRLGMVQAFTAEEGDKNNKAGDAKMDLNTVPFSELVTEVKRRNTFPTQIFSLDEIKKDREIIPFFEKLEKLEKEITAKDKSLKDLEVEKTTLSKKIESVTVKDKLAKILTDNKLVTVTDTQRKFIEKRFKGIEDTSDEGIKKYIESEIVEYKSMIEILGAPKDEIVSNDDTTSVTDATKAKNNPLLEEDFNANI
jgi:hypothetical protein